VTALAILFTGALYNARLYVHVDRLRGAILRVSQPLLLAVDDDDDELKEGGINDDLPGGKRISAQLYSTPSSPRAAASAAATSSPPTVASTSVVIDHHHNRTRQLPMSPISARQTDDHSHHADEKTSSAPLVVDATTNDSAIELSVGAATISTTAPLSPTHTGTSIIHHRSSMEPLVPEAALLGAGEHDNGHERLLTDLLRYVSTDVSNQFRIFGLELNLGLVARITLIVGGAFATGIGNFVLSKL
jgi:hypothetical protein